MEVKLIRLTHIILIQLHLVAELYHLQFWLQAASPEACRYTVVNNKSKVNNNVYSVTFVNVRVATNVFVIDCTSSGLFPQRTQ
jgi:hypothetical protein